MLCLAIFRPVANGWIRVSAGSYALVSYTRFRGPAVAWPTAWRLSLSLIPFQLAAAFFARTSTSTSPPPFLLSQPTSHHTPPWSTFCLSSCHLPYTDFVSLEFKEIRKEWKARKKEEESQRKAAEERERAAAQAAQAGQVDAPGSSDPSQGGQPPAYGSGVRPQLPPIGYQPADGQVNGQYGGPGGGMVYQSNGQMGYPPNYPHSPYQSGPVYQQRE